MRCCALDLCVDRVIKWSEPESDLQRHQRSTGNSWIEAESHCSIRYTNPLDDADVPT